MSFKPCGRSRGAGARQSMPLVLAGNLLELLKPAMEQLKENRHEEKEETKYE